MGLKEGSTFRRPGWNGMQDEREQVIIYPRSEPRMAGGKSTLLTGRTHALLPHCGTLKMFPWVKLRALRLVVVL